MANRYMKGCSTSLIIREMKMKITVLAWLLPKRQETMVLNLTPVTMVIIKKTRNNILMRIWQKREPLSTVRGNIQWCSPMENIIEVPQKIESRITIWSNNSTSRYLSKENENTRKDICTTIFIAVLFIIAKTWKQPKCPLMDEWIKRMWCVCVCIIYNTYIYIIWIWFSHKKERNPAICDNMDRPWWHYTKWISQAEKEKYLWSHLYIKSKKKKTNQTNKTKLIVIKNRLMVARGEVQGMGEVGEGGQKV